jgi:hypothetical protein
MIVIEVFARGCEPRWRPMPNTLDTSSPSPTVNVATFPFRRAGSMPAVISLDPITAINAPSAR